MVFVGRFALRVATSECIKVTQNSQLPALQPNNFFEYADPYTIVWAVSQSDRNAGADLGGRCRGCAPPPPRDDLRFSNTPGILQKKNYVVYWC